MKKYLAIALALVAAVACQKEMETADSTSKVFSASMESCDETKTFTDESLQVKWSEGDYIDIWKHKRVSDKYTISALSVGKNYADLELVEEGKSSDFTAKLAANIGYYPYSENIACLADGTGFKLENIVLPETQAYVANSFGNGALPMVAVSSEEDDYDLSFKNVCGILRIVLSGDMLVKNVSVTGNNNEILCGTAEVSASNAAMPTISMTGDGKTVTLDCGEGVQVSSKTSFDIVLPPVTFAKGFTINVNGKEYFKTEKQQTIIRSHILCMSNKTVMSNDYLKFTSEGETTIALTKNGTPDDITLLYFKESDGEWKNYTVGDGIALADGESVSFKAGEGGNSTFSKDSDNNFNFTMSGDGKVKASGNVMSLLDAKCESVTCSDGCFSNLFAGCSSLTSAPELPATTLAGWCYSSMFSYCSGLTSAPELPATTLADWCYHFMFSHCSGLTSTPELPATTLADYCYNWMFSYCSSLTSAPELPATTLANWCYYGMFAYCSGLTSAPELPATTLADGCYNVMFVGCTALSTAPELPATTLAESCYSQMLGGCTALTQAPKLPATALAKYCYQHMFCGCTSLTTAPELPATTLANSCYRQMFDGCSKLNYIKMLATDISAENCMTDWVDGVASTGTFVKNSTATWDVTGTSGVPEGWMVETDLSESATANSYIVSKAGNYRIKTVKGNTSESVGTVASAAILWESFGTDTSPSVGNLVSDISYTDGYISFKASDKKGNAVIAAKDANGNILWSWHIWMTDTPADQVYNNDAGTMMDRNLGATSATPGDVHALGLLYQWGRKDPFMGSSSISGNTKAASTITWPSAVESDATNGTIEYATANPTTVIKYNSSNNDWYYTGSSATDNTRWLTSSNGKGLYDPCPAGYRVPDGGSSAIWSKAFGTSSFWSTSSNWDSTNKGMDFGSTDKTLGTGTIWYPASGCLYGNNGALNNVGNYGFYWSCTPTGYDAYNLYFYFIGYVRPLYNTSRATGQSVRCCKEQ